jgi:VIT1/CCC1 family predicted Fe2+/Mn2+ transporter
VVPWLFVGGSLGIGLSGVAAGLGLFLVGAVVTLFTGRGALFSGARMFALGMVGAALTFAIGRLVGGTTGV